MIRMVPGFIISKDDLLDILNLLCETFKKELIIET